MLARRPSRQSCGQGRRTEDLRASVQQTEAGAANSPAGQASHRAETCKPRRIGFRDLQSPPSEAPGVAATPTDQSLEPRLACRTSEDCRAQDRLRVTPLPTGENPQSVVTHPSFGLQCCSVAVEESDIQDGAMMPAPRDASPPRAAESAHRLSLPSHLLWRSVLGTPAAYRGSR